jgi:hypothetical protein
LWHAENANLTYDELNTSLDELASQWNIHLVLYDTLTTRTKLSSNGPLSHCSWSLGIFPECHRYKTKNSVGWPIAMTARIGFQLEVTAMPGFHSQYDWCFPEDPEDNTVMEKHGAEALYSTVMCLLHAIRTSDKHGQQDAALRMIQIT